VFIFDKKKEDAVTKVTVYSLIIRLQTKVHLKDKNNNKIIYKLNRKKKEKAIIIVITLNVGIKMLYKKLMMQIHLHDDDEFKNNNSRLWHLSINNKLNILKNLKYFKTN